MRSSVPARTGALRCARAHLRRHAHPAVPARARTQQAPPPHAKRLSPGRTGPGDRRFALPRAGAHGPQARAVYSCQHHPSKGALA
ncbi:hypothetical protein COLSTE_00878 [Collinsella stercoris DSM 13279]|uniref:Uncharacterized protein n=1 Tax=Collinsella stercoris DSM 13279 TaxID=445975 RepID=B6G9Y7_9ACTN|nr:hypothetical protein COLSTE_00878 [Collinsella stercoris DSM 13279]